MNSLAGYHESYTCISIKATQQILEDLNYQVIVSPLNDVDESSSKNEVSQQVLEICQKSNSGTN